MAAALIVAGLWAGMSFAIARSGSFHYRIAALWGILAPPILGVGVVLGFMIWNHLFPNAADTLASWSRVSWLRSVSAYLGILLVLPGIVVACLPLCFIYFALRWLDRRLYPGP